MLRFVTSFSENILWESSKNIAMTHLFVSFHRSLLKKAAQRGPVQISAVRHRSRKAKSEPSLSDALRAEETFTRQKYEDVKNVTRSQNDGSKSYPQHSDHAQQLETNRFSVADNKRSLKIGHSPEIQNETASHDSVLRTAKHKSLDVGETEIVAHAPDAPFVTASSSKIQNMKFIHDLETEDSDIVVVPSLPDFWEISATDEGSTVSGSHARDDSNTSWSSGRGSLSENPPCELPIQVPCSCVVSVEDFLGWAQVCPVQPSCGVSQMKSSRARTWPVDRVRDLK